MYVYVCMYVYIYIHMIESHTVYNFIVITFYNYISCENIKVYAYIYIYIHIYTYSLARPSAFQLFFYPQVLRVPVPAFRRSVALFLWCKNMVFLATLWLCQNSYEKLPLHIVDFPIKHGDFPQLCSITRG